MSPPTLSPATPSPEVAAAAAAAAYGPYKGTPQVLELAQLQVQVTRRPGAAALSRLANANERALRLV